jgi:hypothetical protein
MVVRRMTRSLSGWHANRARNRTAIRTQNRTRVASPIGRNRFVEPCQSLTTCVKGWGGEGPLFLGERKGREGSSFQTTD